MSGPCTARGGGGARHARARPALPRVRRVDSAPVSQSRLTLQEEIRSIDHGSSEAVFKHTYLTPTSDVQLKGEARRGETDQKGILQLALSVAVRGDGEAAANNSLSTSSKRQVLVPLHVRSVRPTRNGQRRRLLKVEESAVGQATTTPSTRNSR